MFMFIVTRRELARNMLRALADKGLAVNLVGASLPGGDLAETNVPMMPIAWVRLGAVTLVVDRSLEDDSIIALTSHDVGFRRSNLISREVRVLKPTPDRDVFELREVSDGSLHATLVFDGEHTDDTIEVHLHALHAPRLAAPKPSVEGLVFLAQRV